MCHVLCAVHWSWQGSMRVLDRSPTFPDISTKNKQLTVQRTQLTRPACPYFRRTQFVFPTWVVWQAAAPIKSCSAQKVSDDEDIPDYIYECESPCDDISFCGRDLQCHIFSCENWYTLGHPTMVPFLRIRFLFRLNCDGLLLLRSQFRGTNVDPKIGQNGKFTLQRGRQRTNLF